MKIFLYKLLIYTLLLGTVLSLYIVIVYIRPDFVDYFYARFTTPKANSLIIGTSRAAQGIKPEIINNSLIPEKENKIINHAFAGGPSSYGPNYYREILNKLNNDSDKGLFILSVIPWSFCTTLDNINDDSLQFYEVKNNLFVGNLKSSSSNPNFEYLYKYWNPKLSVFEHSFKHAIEYGGILQLHPDGWLEVNIPMDSIARNGRVDRSTQEYKEKAETLKWSDTRLYYFNKIISHLKPRGEVYIVRLPVSKGMADLEKDVFPDFDNTIKSIAKKHNIKYINYINESGKFLTTDTHHLWREESERISNQICDSILAYRKSIHIVK